MALSGKVALITGAAKGLGKTFCNSLLQQGAKICVCDVTADEGKATVREFTDKFGSDKAIFVECDVTLQSQIENVFMKTKSHFGSLDVVCNNAGIGSERKWEQTVDINLKAVVRGTLLAIEHMSRSKGGNGGLVVNVSSMAGIIPVPMSPVYCATKHAVVGYTRSWAANPDMKNEGIRFNTLCPSFTDTDLVRNIQSGDVINPEWAKEATKQLGLMTPEFVAEAFMQIVLDDFMNGAVVRVTKKEGITHQRYSNL